jgi:hypothetical protein
VAAAELMIAFRQNDFNFAEYGDRIMAHELGKVLNLRRWLAKLVYPGWPPILLSIFFQIMSRVWP